MHNRDQITCIGNVELIIEYLDGTKEIKRIKNTVLRTGKTALAQALGNEQNDPFDFYIEKMLFGTNGTSGGIPKFVEETRTGLFGTTLLTKNVIASIDASAPTSVILTAVVAFDEGVGSSLNEMALKMKNGDLYSMVTFGDVAKSSSMQLTWNWSVNFL